MGSDREIFTDETRLARRKCLFDLGLILTACGSCGWIIGRALGYW